MGERITELPPKIRAQVGTYTRMPFCRGPYETDGRHTDMESLKQMGLVVEGSYLDVNEVKRYDAGTDTWESVPVYSRTVRMGRSVVTIFEPTR